MKKVSAKLNSFSLSSLVLLVTGLLLSGCNVGPDYQRPETPAHQAVSFVHQSEETPDAADPNLLDGVEPWWRRFGDQVTIDLVEQALAGNFDLKASAGAVLEAEALLSEAKGSQLPTLGYNFNRSRSRNAFTLPKFGPGQGGGLASTLSTNYRHEISAGYVVDLFGKLRRNEEAVWRQLLSTEAQREALTHVIVAQVVRSRTQIATLQRSLDIARANTGNWQQYLGVIERRYDRGLASSVDVRIARENLAASQASEIQHRQSLVQALNALDVLLGQQPGKTGHLERTLAELPDLEPAPVGLPAWLLDRRPDLIQAEMQLAAATARVGLNIAQLYPDLTLSAGYGFQVDESREIPDLFDRNFQIYSAVINLAQPIFQGGQLRARVDAAEARVEQAAAQYAGAVLTAMREVEDAMSADQLLIRQLAAVQEQFKEAQAAEGLAWSRYQQGVTRLLEVLETERSRRQAENALVTVKGQLWSNRVDLFLALGGDWRVEKPGVGGI